MATELVILITSSSHQIVIVVMHHLVEVIIHTRITLSPCELVPDQVLFKGEPNRDTRVFRIKVRVSKRRPYRRDSPLLNDCYPINVSTEGMVLYLLHTKVCAQSLLRVL